MDTMSILTSSRKITFVKMTGRNGYGIYPYISFLLETLPLFTLKPYIIKV